jgi:uncharacterized protein (TIGR03435 family)
MSLRKSLATLIAVAVPIMFSVNARQSRAQSQTANTSSIAPLCKTVSIKPNKSGIKWETITPGRDRVTATNETPLGLIRNAYTVEDNQILGAPSWLDSERYDIEAKAAISAAGELDKTSPDQNERMLQAVLSDRFKLAVHRETKQIPVYELVRLGAGSNLRESAPAYAESNVRVIQAGNGRITGREVPIATLAKILSEQLDRPVLDKTGLTNHYDLILQWEANPESSGAAISAALQEQLGLKLEPTQILKEFLVIDHVETPSAD